MRYVNPKEQQYVSQFVPLNLEYINSALQGKQASQDKQQAYLDDNEAKILNLTDGYRTAGLSKQINAEYKPLFDELAQSDLTSSTAHSKIKDLINRARTDQRIQNVIQDYTKGNPEHDAIRKEKAYNLAIDPNLNKDNSYLQLDPTKPYKGYDSVIDQYDNPSKWQADLKDLNPTIMGQAWTDIDYIDGDYKLTDKSGKVTSLNADDPQTAKIINGYVDNYYKQGDGEKYWKAFTEKNGIPPTKAQMAKEIFKAARIHNKYAQETQEQTRIQIIPDESNGYKSKGEKQTEVNTTTPLGKPISHMDNIINTQSTTEWQASTVNLQTDLTNRVEDLNNFNKEQGLVRPDGTQLFNMVDKDGTWTVEPIAGLTAQEEALVKSKSDMLIGFKANISNIQDNIESNNSLIKEIEDKTKISYKDFEKSPLKTESDIAYDNTLSTFINNLKWSGVPISNVRDIKDISEIQNNTKLVAVLSTGETLNSYDNKNSISKATGLTGNQLDKYILENYKIPQTENDRLKQAIELGFTTKGAAEGAINKANQEKMKILNRDPKIAGFEKAFRELSVKKLMPVDGFGFGNTTEAKNFQSELKNFIGTSMLGEVASLDLRDAQGNPVEIIRDKNTKAEDIANKTELSYWRFDDKDNSIRIGIVNPNIKNGEQLEVKKISGIDDFLIKSGSVNQVDAGYLGQMNDGFKYEGDAFTEIGYGDQKIKIEKMRIAGTRGGIQVKPGQYYYKLGGVEKISDTKAEIIANYRGYFEKTNTAIDMLTDYKNMSDADFSRVKNQLPVELQTKDALDKKIQELNKKINEGK